MAGMEYVVEYYNEWNDGSATGATLKLQVKHLHKLFDQLYDKVILGSITDVEMFTPGMINEITLTIRKMRPGEVVRRKKKNPVIDADTVLKFNSEREGGVKYDLLFSLKNKGTKMGSLDFVNENLKEVFDQLWAEVVEPSIMDPITDKITSTTEMLDDIHITIMKKRVKWPKK